MLLNMITSYIQNEYKEAAHFAKERLISWGDQLIIKDEPLHLHILKFMKHYGIRLNSRDTGISIRAGGFLFGKTEDDAMNGRGGFTRLYVENPFNRMEDCGSGAYNYALVKKHFKLAHDLLYSYGPYSLSFLALIISDKLFTYFANSID